MTIALLAALFVIALQAWVIYVLARQHGRTLHAHDELSARVSAAESAIGQLRAAVPTLAAPPAPASGLAVGDIAPTFSLPNVAGKTRSLSDYAGKRFVLIFFNPACGFCQQLAPRLGHLPPGAPAVVVMSRGDADVNRSLAREHGWHAEVLLEPGWDVASTYRTNATPTAYLVGADGRIASALAAGIDDVMKLIESSPHASMRTRPLSESRLRRDGLDAGTPAPDFTLPDLTGRQHSLSEFRGRRLLLVFSDPGCGPCQMLAPKLEEIHRRRDIAGLHVLMVSRGGVPANREKAREHGLTFPVLLQNAWEISREYAMFATPIAYLIDETGTIASGAAVGVEPILALARPLDARADTLVGVSA